MKVVLVLTALVALSAGVPSPYTFTNDKFTATIHKVDTEKTRVQFDLGLFNSHLHRRQFRAGDDALNHIFDEILDVTSYFLQLLGLENKPVPDTFSEFWNFGTHIIGIVNFTQGVLHGVPTLHRYGDVVVTVNTTSNYTDVEVLVAFDSLQIKTQASALTNASDTLYTPIIQGEMVQPLFNITFRFDGEQVTLPDDLFQWDNGRVINLHCEDADGNEIECGPEFLVEEFAGILETVIAIFVVEMDVEKAARIITEILINILPVF